MRCQEREPSRDREEHRYRDREDQHHDHEDQEDRHHCEERREDRRRDKESEREWRKGHRPRERSSCDCGAITIGAVAPITDLVMITRLCCISPIVTPMTDIMIAEDVAVRTTNHLSFIYYFF